MLGTVPSPAIDTDQVDASPHHGGSAASARVRPCRLMQERDGPFVAAAAGDRPTASIMCGPVPWVLTGLG